MVIAFLAGNITANSRFILRGLRLGGAPHIGTPDRVQLIKDIQLTGNSAAEAITIPPGFEEILVLWSNIEGDDAGIQALELTLNADTSAHYDDSYIALGTASNTNNAASGITIGTFADASGAGFIDDISTGFVTISNRKGQEKVVIGSEVFFDNSAEATADDLAGYHIEGKWRNKEDEISTVTITPTGGNMISGGRITVLGLKL